jgi:hypothetical protein
MSTCDKNPVRELLRFLLSWEMLVIQSTSVALVVFAPDDVLTKHPELRSFVSVVEKWIPPVVDYQSVSSFPEISGFYFSIMFLLTPIILFYSPYMRDLTFKFSVIDYKSRPIRYWVAAIVCCLFCVLTPPFLYFWNDAKYEFFPSMPIRSSKISLAMLGWFAAGGAAWILVSHAIWLPVVVVKRAFGWKLEE